MRKLICMAIAVGCALGAMAADVEKSATRAEMRKQFEGEWRKQFFSRIVLPAELVEREHPELAATNMTWKIALPLDEGGRLRFILANFERGRFVSGTMVMMGLPEVQLTAKDFDALREVFPMLAACDRKEVPLCLHHPRSAKMKRPVPEDQKVAAGLDPLRTIFGDAFLFSMVFRLGANPERLRLRADLIGPDGKRITLGIAKCPRLAERIEVAAICAAVAAAHPDLISEREQVEYYLKGALEYAFVMPEAKPEVAK